jgi:1,4-dihydroxy-2-naphthoate octaprenyltransferase
MSFTGPLYLWSLIVLLSLPLAFRLLNQMMKQVPADADARTAQLDTAFGVLLVMSLVLEGVF